MVVAVDFDGTLCENEYPEIGQPKEEILEYIKMLKKQGHKIILWTCRCGEMLEAAVEWCKSQELEFDAVNKNIEEHIKIYGLDSRKVFADVYLDDKSMTLSEVVETQEKLLKRHYSEDECKGRQLIAATVDGDCSTFCDMVCPWDNNSPCSRCGLTDCMGCEEKEIYIERRR